MQTQNRFLDDLARVASGAIGVAADMRGEIETRLREQFEKVLARMDLVTREEFEVVKAMAAKAREEQESLAARLAKLEARAHPARTRSTAAPRKPGRKTGAGASAAKKRD